MGKIEPECQVSNGFFLGGGGRGAPRSLTAINHVLDEFKGRDVAFVSDWLTKKVFKRSLLKTAEADDDCSSVGYDRKIRR